MATATQERLEKADELYIDQVIANQGEKPGALLGILEAVQDHDPHKYLPMETLRYIAAKTGIPLARIYSVRRSMRSSTCSRRERTRCASVVERRATREGRATC
jgi:NADH:ubiquinone oxidoreductase subunit E